jgi:serine phosphatase RsbU (regulator of sigma subunit)
MPKLTFENGPRDGTEFIFDKDTVIGRSRAADLHLDDSSVSRRHAMLKVGQDDCFVADLGSENGTFVNGRRVTTPLRVKDGDLLTLGVVMARFARVLSAAIPAPAGMPLMEASAAASMVTLSIPADDSLPATGSVVSKAEGAVMTQRLRFLNELGRISGQGFDQQLLLSFVLDQLLDLFPHAERAFVLFGDTESDALVPAGTRIRAGAPPGAVVSRTLLREAIRRQEAILVSDAQSDQRFSANESVFLAGIRSAMCAPMIFDQRTYGVIQVDRGRSVVPFDRADMSLLVGIATHVAMALGFARLHASVVERELIERDMTLARKIQQHFLPQQLPKITGYSVAVEYASALSIGGDFYDFLELEGGLIGIALGDVSGKGVSAALYAAKVSSDLRHYATGPTDPRTILERLNRSLASSDAEGMFVTLVLATLDPRAHQLTVANAGHTIPLVRTAAGQVTELGDGGNLPLGVSERAVFDQLTHQLDRGESITFFTDGVTEGMNSKQDLFGPERLSDALARSAGSPAAALATILAALKNFVGTAPQSDDITLVCCRRDPS